MSHIHARLLSEVKRLEPQLDENTLVEVFLTNLDLTEPNKRRRAIGILSFDELHVWVDDVLLLREKTENIESASMVTGVGCELAEYVRKSDGEHICFARGDGRYYNTIAKAVKRINHYLRHGDTDFSRMEAGREASCPKCGRPYPRGSSTCPRCSSKSKALRRLLVFAGKEWKPISFSVIFFFFSAGIGVIIPVINRIMVDDYIQADATGKNGFWIGFAFSVFSIFLADLLRRGANIGRGYFLTASSNRIVKRLRNTVFCKIQELSIAKISRRTSGELMQRVNSDTQNIANFLVYQIPGVLEQLLTFLAVAVILLFYDWKMGLLILLPMPFVAFSFRMFWRLMRTLFGRRWQLSSQENAVLHDIFSGIRVVKAYGMEKREEERFLKIAADEREALLRIEKFWALLNPPLQFFLGLGEYILLYYVGTGMLNGVMTAGEMSQFSSYAGMVFGPLLTLMNFPRQFVHMMTSLTRVCEVLDETVDVENGTDCEIREIRGDIDINHISFGYEESDEVLKDVDLHIKKGDFIGLVGKSGVGKSTLINLIMRMYDVDEGAICIDGVDIRDIPQEVLRSQMGVVLQENFLFTGTVWQNLSYAKPNATREEVIQAAKMAGAHEFIIRLPDGYNTYVGERGHTLSGGERQRISIARALLHDPKILILDEATASLDTETEKLIQDALAVLCKGRTTIAIAHRLSTLRNATRLVVLDKGGVAEVGTHDELMEREGIYHGLVMAQREMTRMDR